MHDFVNLKAPRSLAKARWWRYGVWSLVGLMLTASLLLGTLTKTSSSLSPIEKDIQPFLLLYAEQGGEIAQNSAPFLLTLNEAYYLMGVLPDEVSHPQPIVIIGGKHRFMVTQVTRAACQSIAKGRIPLYDSSADALSHIAKSGSGVGRCLQARWPSGMSPLYAQLQYNTTPGNVASYLYYIRLPDPAPRARQQKDMLGI